MTKPSKFEAWSAPILLFIHGLPRFVLPAFTLVLLLIGLFTTGIPAGLSLLAVGLIIAWLVALSWKLLPMGSRVIRSLVLVLVFWSAINAFTK